jgi:hypothetical protein
MFPHGKLRAWIESQGGKVSGRFIGVPIPNGPSSSRPPARKSFSSREEARQWVEAEAHALGLPIEWVDVTPGR